MTGQSGETQTTEIKSLKEVIPNYEWFWVWMDGKWEIGKRGAMAIFDTMDDRPDAVVIYGAPSIGIGIPPTPEDIYPCCGALKRMWHHYDCKESDYDKA